MLQEIRSLNSSKACPKTSIPPKIIEDNYDIFTFKLHNDINNSIDYSIFPDKQKEANITPVHKKDDRTDKTNYRPVSILPAISKIFEKLLYYQNNKFMDKKLSKQLCGFRKGHSAQHCLLVMLEKWIMGDARGFC